MDDMKLEMIKPIARLLNEIADIPENAGGTKAKWYIGYVLARIDDAIKMVEIIKEEAVNEAD